MSDGEIDLDAFVGPGPEIELDPEPAPRVVNPTPAPDVAAAVAAEQARHAQLTMDGPEVPVESAPVARDFIRALFYVSKTGGEGHVVVVHDLPGGRAVLCNCPSSRNLNARPQGCWASQDARLILGIPEPRRT